MLASYVPFYDATPSPARKPPAPSSSADNLDEFAMACHREFGVRSRSESVGD
jgi:hypothetical protein